MRLSERRLLFQALDLLVLVLALLVVLSPDRPGGPGVGILWERPYFFLGVSALWLLLASALDAYELPAMVRTLPGGSAVTRAWIFTAGIWSLVWWLLAGVGLHLPRPAPYLTGFFLLPLGALLLLRGALTFPLKDLLTRKVLLVGSGAGLRTVSRALENLGAGAYEVEGLVSDGGDEPWGEVEIGPLLGGLEELPRLVEERGIGTVVLAVEEGSWILASGAVDRCLELGTEVVPMPAMVERLTGRVPLEFVGRYGYVGLPLEQAGTGRLYPLGKRLMDLVLASLGMVVLGLMLPFLALALVLESPGPVFYTQDRVGKGGKVFRVFKLRSMVPDAERGSPVWAAENDDRVTRVGALLRRTHVDEFPQFLNILKGDMSAVGPRPERPEFVRKLEDEVPHYRVRHAALPGMAGWGLVTEGYGATWEDAAVKLERDLYYLKHRSLWMDLVIITKTFLDALALGGR